MLSSCWQLQLEVDHLEELKLQNIRSVIQGIRAELADYWDKCFYSQEQREGFSPYYDGGCWLFLFIDSPVGAVGCLLAHGSPCCLLNMLLYSLQRTIQRPCLISTKLRWRR